MKYKYVLIFALTYCISYCQPGSESNVGYINATIPYQGYEESNYHLGTGQAKIFYDNVDGELDKPVFVIDGFDPEDANGIDDIYGLFNFNSLNLAEVLRDEGYDIVVLNFPVYTSISDGVTIIDGGVDYIQRNAFILIELINIINTIKSGNEQNVVIGPSMGGLISRYALRYMELNNMDHDTRLYISFDSPHIGANIPIGLQYFFNYMVNGEPNFTEFSPFLNGILNSSAAKQMLIDHYLGHLDTNSTFQQNQSLKLPIGAPNFRDQFQLELDNMGFPENSRNIAVSNGSGNVTFTGYPGMDVISHTFNTGVISGLPTQALVTIRFTPEAGQSNTVTDVKIQAFLLFFWTDIFTFGAYSESPITSSGLDSAPGGLFDMTAFGNFTNNPIATEFINNLNIQYFNFIPTLSSLAISNDNWYSYPNLQSSPFDAVFIPSSNESHVELTTGNIDFILNEILNQTLSNTTPEENQLRLKQNPVKNHFTIISPSNIGRVKINIFDMTGKIVYQEVQELGNLTNIPINLKSGLYLLRIENSTLELLKVKLLVN